MKSEKFVTGGTGFVLGCLLSFGAMGCMLSGLPLEVENAQALYRGWLIAAAVGAVLFSFRKGWRIALPAGVLGLLFLSKYTDHFSALAYRIARVYDSAYGWGIPDFSGVEWWLYPADLPLMVWGCLLALTAAAAVVMGRGIGLTLVLTLIPVGSTVVVTNTPPEGGYLFAVMLALILLVLTATVRRHSPHQGAKLAVLVSLPVGLLLGLLFLVCPQEGYVNRSEEHLDRVVSWGQSVLSSPFDRTGLNSQPPVGANESVVNKLSTLGPRNTVKYTVMEVIADFSDTLYLRGQDFDSYDGLAWTANGDREERFGSGTGGYRGTITVRTLNAANVLYLPYYPTDEQTVTGGRVRNAERTRIYSFSVRSPMDLDKVIMDLPTDPDFDSVRYTALPSTTRRWAVEYLRENLGSNPSVEDIADHVRGSALYDTNTSRMSREYGDFVQWFLEESETGYCIHFATATAVLLRAAGIPARYVTGYMCTTEADGTVAVTSEEAHAWAEYYNESLGAWVVVESTPADLRQEEETPVTQPLPTEPRPTQTEPTEPATRPQTPVPGGDIVIPDDLNSLRLRGLWNGVKWLLLPLGIWLAAEVQYRIRRRLRRRGGTPNERALEKWQDVALLCRFLREKLPGDLEALAEKAKFSQHTLTAEELAAFDAWLRDTRQKLGKKPWYLRLLCRYLLAVL